MIILTVDPGVTFGWALWDTDQGEIHPIEIGTFNGVRGQEWQCKTVTASMHFKELIGGKLSWLPQEIYCEMPVFMEGGKGMAASRKGSVIELAYMVGCLSIVAWEQGIPFHHVSPKWKGDMRDDQVLYRLKKRLGREFFLQKTSGHCRDAIGIGLHVLGVW